MEFAFENQTWKEALHKKKIGFWKNNYYLQGFHHYAISKSLEEGCFGYHYVGTDFHLSLVPFKKLKNVFIDMFQLFIDTL